MRIGEVARRAGVTTRALRYYEEQGLITSGRDRNGYRVYDPATVPLVRDIARLLRAGLGSADVRQFVHCLGAPPQNDPAQGDSTEVESTQGRSTQVDPPQGTPSQGDSTRGVPAQGEPSRSEPWGDCAAALAVFEERMRVLDERISALTDLRARLEAEAARLARHRAT